MRLLYGRRVDPATASTLTGYLLTKVGQAVTARFAVAIADLGLRPHHYGLLYAVATTRACSQLELGRTLGIGPSAVVATVDDLEHVGAVTREPVSTDRRRFTITLTDYGRTLLAEGTRRGAAVDAHVLRSLSRTQREHLDRALATIVGDPTGGPIIRDGNTRG